MRGRRIILLFLFAAAPGCGDGPPPPSILLVSIDTLRADALGAYGNPGARTPVADRLAASGTIFTSVRSACPLTLPSHLTMLTGLLPPEHGVRDNDPARPVPPAAVRGYPTAAELLRDAGYETAGFVSSSVLSGRTGIDAGFATWDEPGEVAAGSLRFAERSGAETVRAAAAWLETADEPFFLFVHLFDPHEPYLPPVAFRSGAAPNSPQAYADEVAYADRCVGELLDVLRESGRDEETLVILTSDHGEGLGEHGEPTHGYLLYDTTLRVPLVVRWPGRVEAGAVREDEASLADLFGTILGAAGAAPEGAASLLHGPIGRPVFAESLYGWRHMGWAQLLAVVSGGRKLIEGAGTELYDLREDPDETEPSPEAPPDLLAALDRYRDLTVPVGEDEAEELEPLAGLPYAGGVGRGRTSRWLPVAENRRRKAPDPGIARALDAVKARVGKEPRPAVERELAELLVRDPGNPSIAFWLGRNAMAAGDASAAADFFREAFRLGLSEAKVLSLWLKSLLLANRLEDAGAALREHLDDVVPDTSIWLMAGAYHQVLGDRPEAARCLARAKRLARSDRDRELVSRFGHNLGQGNGK